MPVLFSSISNTPAVVSSAVSQAAHEFSRFATGQAVGTDSFQPPITPSPPINTTISSEKKANPWLMMAALTLLKLPFSFLAASTVNMGLFKIPFLKSAKEELYGIGAEVLGTVGIKLVDDHLEGDSCSKMSHEKQLEIASGVVSFIGTSISTFGCIKDSKKLGAWGPLSHLGKGWRIVASLAVGTLCGVVEGFFTAKLEPWLEKKLAR